MFLNTKGEITSRLRKDDAKTYIKSSKQHISGKENVLHRESKYRIKLKIE